MLKLYSYYRSSAAYRCRIALNIKGVAHDTAYVHIVRDGGEQFKPAYLEVNPQAQVPTMEVDGTFVPQSVAIIEYLEETHPEPRLLPGDALMRARIRAFSLAIACDIHPLNNLRVMNYLKGPLGHPQSDVDTWYARWVEAGLAACQALLPKEASGRFCFGDTPTMADCCLVPQMYNARRFNCSLEHVPRLVAIDAACRELPAFAKAAPEAQADAA